MRVLFVYDSISPIGSGSQLAVFNWLKNLNQKNINTNLLTEKVNQKFKKNLADKLIYNPSFNLSFFYPFFYLSIYPTAETIKKSVFFPQTSFIFMNLLFCLFLF